MQLNIKFEINKTILTCLNYTNYKATLYNQIRFYVFIPVTTWDPFNKVTFIYIFLSMQYNIYKIYGEIVL